MNGLPPEYKIVMLSAEWDRSTSQGDKWFYKRWKDKPMVVEDVDGDWVKFTGEVLNDALYRKAIDTDDTGVYDGTWGPFYDDVTDPRDITKYRLNGTMQNASKIQI